VLVWDAPVRVFHWLMVLSFAGAYLTAESERWRLLHVTLGYTLAGLVVFRMLWGLLARAMRASSFVRGPAAVVALPAQLFGGRNPNTTSATTRPARWPSCAAGAGAGRHGVGLGDLQRLGGEWVEEVHEALANGMLAWWACTWPASWSAAGCTARTWCGSMVTGRKRGPRKTASAAPGAAWPR
jgi:cytochrome b